MPQELMQMLSGLEADNPHFWSMVFGAGGVLLGLFLAWLFGGRPSRRKRRMLTAEIERMRGTVGSLGRNLATAEAQAVRVGKLESRVSDLTERLMATRAELSEVSGTLTAERQAHQIRVEELRRLDDELQSRFQTIASGALDRNARAFLGFVSERFEKHRVEADEALAERQKAIEGLVKPLQDNLGKVEGQIGALEKAREGAYAAVTTQITQLAEGQMRLQGETARLVQALRAPKTRGRWGEFQLRQVLELAGMMEHVDFVAERAIPGSEGALRPDAIVRLPGGKTIVIDAKTPLEAYLNAIEAETAEARASALAAHARQTRQHVRALSAKAYWDALDSTPDFVVMFVPGEAFYGAAIEVDPELFEYAVAAKVLISTPTTLIALVKAIAYGWQQDLLTKNALEVAASARDLYERLRKYGEHMGALGKHLRQSVEKYNAAIGSLEGRVLPAARRFETLGVIAQGDEMEALGPLEQDPRGLTAPELASPGETEPEDQRPAAPPLSDHAPSDRGLSDRALSGRQATGHPEAGHTGTGRTGIGHTPPPLRPDQTERDAGSEALHDDGSYGELSEGSSRNPPEPVRKSAPGEA
ncbi:MAG: DNA recombination protein RmuC [Pseudomonadota bacterium]